MVDRYRPSLSVAHLTTQLAFKTEDECLAWLQELNIKFIANDPTKVDCKASVVTDSYIDLNDIRDRIEKYDF